MNSYCGQLRASVPYVKGQTPVYLRTDADPASAGHELVLTPELRDKVEPWFGKDVRVTGTIAGGKITVSTVELTDTCRG